MIDDVLLHIFEGLELYYPVLRTVCRQWYRLLARERCSMYFHNWFIWTIASYNPMLSVWAIGYYHDLDPEGLYRKALIDNARAKEGRFNEVLRYYEKRLSHKDNNSIPYIPEDWFSDDYHIEYRLATGQIHSALSLYEDHSNFLKYTCKFHNLEALTRVLNTFGVNTLKCEFIIDYSARYRFIDGLNYALKHLNIHEHPDLLVGAAKYAAWAGALNIIKYLERRINLDYLLLMRYCVGELTPLYERDEHNEINYNNVILMKYLLSKLDKKSISEYCEDLNLLDISNPNYPLIKTLTDIGAWGHDIYISHSLRRKDNVFKKFLIYFLQRDILDIEYLFRRISMLDDVKQSRWLMGLICKHYRGKHRDMARFKYFEYSNKHPVIYSDNDVDDDCQDDDFNVDRTTFKQYRADRMILNTNKCVRRRQRSQYKIRTKHER